MDNRVTSYSQASVLLSRNLSLYKRWDEQDIKSLLALIESLPAIDTEENHEALIASQLAESVRRLVYNIGTAAYVDGLINISKAEESAWRLERLWRVWERFSTSMPSNGFAAFLLAALRNEAEANLLVEIAHLAQERGFNSKDFYWPDHMAGRLKKTFGFEAVKAITEQDADYLTKVFEAAATIGITFEKFMWANFANQVKANQKATQTGRLLEIVWNASSSQRGLFESREWGSFASSAGNSNRGDLLKEMWDACVLSNASLAAEGFLAFAFAAQKTKQAHILEQVWEMSKKSGAVFQVKGWNLWAMSAGELEVAVLFEDIWRSSESSRKAFDNATWSSFVNAAGRVRSPDLVREVWQEAETVRSDLDGAVLSSFAHAAGRVEDARLLQEVWELSLNIRPDFENSVWSSFAHAAERVGRPDLLREIWDSGESVRSTFDHAEWGNFIHAAHALNATQVLVEIFRTIKGIFDPARYTGFGTLFRPLLAAAVSCPDEELRKEMIYILRVQGITVEGILQVMRDVEPQPLAEKGLEFEGAGRSLMRYLNYSFYFESENRFLSNVDRVVEGILSLPEDRQLFAWIQLLGRGQESHRMLLRARYAEALREVARFRPIPWRQLSQQEKASIVGDIQDQTDEGLVGRINLFMTEMDHLNFFATGVDDADLPGQQIIDYIIANHDSYFTGRSEQEPFFENLRMKLSECDAGSFDRHTWSALVRKLIALLGETTLKRMEPELRLAAHDIVKAACWQASDLLNKPNLDTAVIESVGYGIVDTVQCFELMVMGLGQRQRETIGVNIRPVLRMFLERGFQDNENAVIDIPTEVRVQAWHGAKRDLIQSIFGSIRANVDRALQPLTPQQQRYHCRVSMAGQWVRFEIENSFNPSQQKNPLSTGIGLRSTRRRIRLLGGREIHPFPESITSADPPIWRVAFELPAVNEQEGVNAAE